MKFMSIQPKLKNKQRRIGLTGGIASGKSTIAKYIKEYIDIPISVSYTHLTLPTICSV